jgi:hypothetical protein
MLIARCFIDDIVSGVLALRPKVVILYPPHDRFHAMMGIVSEPWPAFAKALCTRFPEITVYTSRSLASSLPWAPPIPRSHARSRSPAHV